MTPAPCPNCHGTLDAVTLPFSPPWVCEVCRRGWWNAELAASVVVGWRPGFADFGGLTLPERAGLAAAVTAEMGAA